MKRLLALLIIIAGCLLPVPAHAQFSRIIGITLRQNNNSLAAYYSSPFTIKAGPNCSWSISGTTGTFDCSGGAASSVPFSGITSGTNTTATMVCGTGCSISTTGTGTISATPGGAVSSVQYNNAGAFGGITNLSGNQTNCGGLGADCQLLSVLPTATFKYIMVGTATDAPAGNYFDIYQFGSTGGLYMDSYNGTHGASFTLDYSGDSGVTAYSPNGGISVVTHDGFESSMLSRFMVQTHTNQIPVTGDFALSGGWGSTGAKANIRGSDNAPEIQVTPGGTGIAANPTITFTFHNGVFGNTSQTWVGVCQQRGGTGAVADITWASTTTTLVMTYNGTPVSGSTYIISCFGTVNGEN